MNQLFAICIILNYTLHIHSIKKFNQYIKMPTSKIKHINIISIHKTTSFHQGYLQKQRTTLSCKLFVANYQKGIQIAIPQKQTHKLANIHTILSHTFTCTSTCRSREH